MNEKKILYQLNVEDFQKVAQDIINRDLSETELNLLENKIGEYFDWYGIVENCINKEVL